MSTTPHVRAERRGPLGVLVLDRQNALNALTREMVQAMSLQLAAWKDDPAVTAVLVRAAPGRAFCAGGDIRAVAETGRDRGAAAATPFFRDEYRLNWRISTFPKPYVALLDGVTMGGGVGISVHGRYRVLTEQTLFAMPETGIGFFPDVGGTWFLPRLPGEIGLYLGLTGARLRAADCLAAGIGTHLLPAAALAELEDRLAGGADVAASLAALALPAPDAELPALRPAIDACFAAPTLADVLDRLAAEDSGWGKAQLAELAGKSPMALRVTFAQLRRGRMLASLAEALQLEYRMVHRLAAEADFIEGVRALLVDKDRRPRWRHGSPGEVGESEVEACFAPLPQGDLAFDWQDV
ncbi:MAG: enoyl-CoA hydratase/isomerase family protein [Geminicoccaceae bacterium]